MASLKSGVLEVRLADMPEVLSGLRREMASILREAADEEMIPRTAKRLREIANVFECGQREDDRG